MAHSIFHGLPPALAFLSIIQNTTPRLGKPDATGSAEQLSISSSELLEGAATLIERRAATSDLLRSIQTANFVADRAVLHACRRYLALALGHDDPTPNEEWETAFIVGWNDKPDRTHAEGVEKLREAATLARLDGN